jgi:hypothetical protein
MIVINDTRTSCWLHRPAISNDTREERLLTTIVHGCRVDSIPLCAKMHPTSTVNIKDSNYLSLLQRMEQLIIPTNIQTSRYKIMEKLCHQLIHVFLANSLFLFSSFIDLS